jgi:uncharacterized membrane protein YqaE (UPF0057 family)
MLSSTFFLYRTPHGERRPISLMILVATLTTSLCVLYHLYSTFTSLGPFLAEYHYSGSTGLIVGTCLMAIPLYFLEKARHRRSACQRLLFTMNCYYLLLLLGLALVCMSHAFTAMQWTEDALGGFAVGLLLGALLAMALTMVAYGAILVEQVEGWWRFYSTIGSTFTPRALDCCDMILHRLQSGGRSTVEGQALLAEDIEIFSELIAGGLPVVNGEGHLLGTIGAFWEGRDICVRLTKLKELARKRSAFSDARFIKVMKQIRRRFLRGEIELIPALIDKALSGRRHSAITAKVKTILRRLRSGWIAIETRIVSMALRFRHSPTATTMSRKTTSRKTTKTAKTKLPLWVRHFRAVCTIVLACLVPLTAVLTATGKLDKAIVNLLTLLSHFHG